MALIIRKRDTGESIDIPSGFVLEANNLSPIFSELGSKTVSTSLPNTPKNRQIFENANRIDIKGKPISKIPILILDGAVQLTGMLYVLSGLNTTNQFEIVIAFDEGIMYEEMKNIKLTQLPNLPIVEKNYADMITYMNYLFHNEALDEELTVFTVYLKDQTYGDNLVNNVVLNAKSDGNNTLKKTTSIDVVSDNKIINVSTPVGYGITPFIKVWALLKYIFSNFGYTIGENPFISDFQLNRLCILNNTADTIVYNRIAYAQLMPDVTISDFLNSLYCRFGAKFFVDNNTRTVNIRLLKDIFSTKNSYQGKIDAVHDISYTDPKQVKLSAARNLDKSSTETDSFADFLKKYNYTIDSVTKLSNTPDLHSGITMFPYEGLIYQTSSGVNVQRKVISSIHFDWNQLDTTIGYEEISSIDECLTMKYVNTFAYIYYGVDSYLANSSMYINGEPISANSGNKLAFAFDLGERYRYSIFGDRVYMHFKEGSILPIFANGMNTLHKEDKDGNVFRYALTFIGEDGCFNRFFKEYDAYLRHSNNIIKFEWDKQDFISSKLDFSKPYLLAGNPILLEKTNRRIGDNVAITAECRTLRLYEPFNLDSEQGLPSYSPIRYQWIFVNNRSLFISITQGNRFLFWQTHMPVIDPNTGNYLPAEGDYTFLRYEFVEIVEDNYGGDRDIWILPPGAQTPNDEISIINYTCKVRFRLTYRKVGQDRTFYENINVDYYSYFRPELI